MVAERSSIHANLNDLHYVSVEIVDAKGNVVPSMEDVEVSYQLSGKATPTAKANGLGGTSIEVVMKE